MLNISEAQARVLRAIAYYEAKIGKKGATQYACSKKILKKLHVSGSTFNDNIKDLEKNLMVLKLKGTTDRNRETKPYSITDIGQIAWLRHSTLDNIKIIQKIFPNIKISLIDDIINQINHPRVKNNFTRAILENALNSFHIENSIAITTDYFKPHTEEIIELSGYKDLIKISFRRTYNVIHPSAYKKFFKMDGKVYENIKNFDELEISVIDRVTFLFYYNLIQSVIELVYAMKVINSITTNQKMIKKSKVISSNDINNSVSEHTKVEIRKALEDLSWLSSEILKKKKKILKIITSNQIITNIMKKNIKDLNENKDTNFDEITNMFIKN